jgi:WD40 repeat protein
MGLAFSPNGELLALRVEGHIKDVTTTFVWVWNAKTYKPIILLPGLGECEDAIDWPVRPLAFSPDGTRLVVADTVIHIYGVTGGL